jgi:hypothetical protein
MRLRTELGLLPGTHSKFFMKQIFEYLRDPSWWFTAFFIAIISSIIAGFAKDYLEALGSNLSTAAKLKQARRSENRERFLSALENSESYLLLSMIRSSGMLILMALSMILLFVSPLISETFSVVCHVARSCSRVDFIIGKLASFVSVYLFGIISVLISYKTAVYTKSLQKNQPTGQFSTAMS